MEKVFASIQFSSPLSVAVARTSQSPFPLYVMPPKMPLKTAQNWEKRTEKCKIFAVKISFQKSQVIPLNFWKISNFWKKNSAKFWKNAVNSTSRQNLVKVREYFKNRVKNCAKLLEYHSADFWKLAQMKSRKKLRFIGKMGIVIHNFF